MNNVNNRENDFYYGLDINSALSNRVFKQETQLTIYLREVREIIIHIVKLMKEFNFGNGNKQEVIDRIKNNLLLINEDDAKKNTRYLSNYLKQTLKFSHNGLTGLDLYFKDELHLKMLLRESLRINDIMDKHIAYREVVRLE